MAGKLALITLDNGHDHTKPTTLGPAGLRALDGGTGRGRRRSRRGAAVAVTGKPYVFAAGADISGDRAGHRTRQARRSPSSVTGCFGRLARPRRPDVRLPQRAALGGGLETRAALRLPHRVRPAAALALPECFLGMVPGWGGAWLLPNLIGPKARPGDRREPAGPEPDAQAREAADSASPTRCSSRPTSWRSRSAGQRGAGRRRHRRAARGRPRAPAGTPHGQGQRGGGRQAARRGAGGLPRAGPARGWPGPRTRRRASPPRTRRWPT